jgi:hypothetical protein
MRHVEGFFVIFRGLIFTLLVSALSATCFAKTDVRDQDDFSKYLENDTVTESSVEPQNSDSTSMHLEASLEAVKPSLQKEITSDENLSLTPDKPATAEIISESNKLEKAATKRVAVYEKPAPIKSHHKFLKLAQLKHRIKKGKNFKKNKNSIASHARGSKKHRAKLASKKIHKRIQQS